MKSTTCLFSILILLVFFSCKKNSEKFTVDPSAQLTFSDQEITFDTIFSSVGSVTRRLWVFNENKHAITISRIHLAGGSSSPFSLILDGVERNTLTDYPLYGGDSMLVLVKVLIDPQNNALPYLVDDSIEFTTNGTMQDVDLLAYGQDATFLNDVTIGCDTTWNNTKPYVISEQVTVPLGCTLTVTEGCRILFHKDATFHVEGTLIVQGTKDSIVRFAHDKLSSEYADIPGQWTGMIFKNTSTGNLIQFAEIRNAIRGITLHQVADADTIAELKLENTILKNCSSHGIIAGGTDVYAVNTLLANCAGYLLRTSGGGNYYFDFCTFANYSYDFFREKPGIRFSNQDTTFTGALNARFRNTVLWGDKIEELEFSDNGTDAFTFTSSNSIIRSTLSISGTGNLNLDPLFESVILKNFRPGDSSPCIDAGITLSGISIDLPGDTRDMSPDIGCYEKQ